MSKQAAVVTSYTSYTSYSSTSKSKKPSTVQEYFEAVQDTKGSVKGKFERKKNGRVVEKKEIKNRKDLQQLISKKIYQ